MDQFTAHLDRGWDLVSRGDLAGALLSAQKGLELDAESPEAHNLIGYIHAAEGNAELALDHYRQAIASDDTFVEAMLNAAEVLMHPVGNFDEALALIEDAIDFMEDDEELADAMLLKVDAFLGMGDREGAARVSAALPPGPFESAGLEVLVGRAKLETGNVEGAAPHIEAAVQRDPDNAEAQYYYGLLLESREDHHGATVAFLKCRELDLRAPRAPWTLPTDQFEKRVEAAIHRLDPALREALDGALVIVVDAPGAEVVAETVDPRVPVLLDFAADDTDAVRVSRVYVYQRNVERLSAGALEIEGELVQALERELGAVLPNVEDEPDLGV